MSAKRLFYAAYGALIIAGLVALWWLSYDILFGKEEVKYVPILAEDQQLNPASRYTFFYEPKPGADYETDDVHNRINSDTLNEDEGRYVIPKPRDVFRIVALGDSNTFGYGVAREDNYGEVLEDMFFETACATRVEIVNLGVPGYDFAYMAERFRLRGEKYEPDLVLWNITSSDFLENEESRQRIFSSLDQTDPYWASRESFERMQREETRKSLLDYHLRSFASFRKAYTGPILFTDLRGPLEADIRSLLEERTEDGGILLVNPENWLDRSVDLFPDRHANESGHRKIAILIYQYLLEQAMMPCSG